MITLENETDSHVLAKLIVGDDAKMCGWETVFPGSIHRWNIHHGSGRLLIVTTKDIWCRLVKANSWDVELRSDGFIYFAGDSSSSGFHQNKYPLLTEAYACQVRAWGEDPEKLQRVAVHNRCPLRLIYDPPNSEDPVP